MCRTCPVGIGHVAQFDVHLRCLFSAEDTHSPGLNLAPDSTGAAAYVLYAIVFQETSVRHIRERELCLSSFPVLAIFLTLSRLRSCIFPLPLQGTLPESLCTWLLFLESLAATRGASSELEGDTVSLPFSAFLRFYVSCPDLSLFTRSILLQEGKRMAVKRRKSIVHLGLASGKIDICTKILMLFLVFYLSIFAIFEYQIKHLQMFYDK